jgi:acyl-coenzyme A synthetase/AMP-(fatty) acid ligase
MRIQVKLRGQRLETEEIQGVLKKHDLVLEAVITKFGETAASEILVAYIVLKGMCSKYSGHESY